MHSVQSLGKNNNWRRKQFLVFLRQFFLRRSDGYVIAEFAVVIPALVSLGIGLLAVLGIGAEQISLNAKCVEVTRILARGDSLPDAIAMDEKLKFEINRDRGLVDVSMNKVKEFSILKFHYQVNLTAHASALDELTLQ